jgi:CarD family transcriptional regulator
MTFETGQTVVHPHHGPATITGIMSRTIKGTERTYLQLDVIDTNLQISVPADTVGSMGLRDIAGDAELRLLFEHLAAPTGHEEQQWGRRFKDNRDKIATGDPKLVTSVVRDLTRRSADKSLSAAEKGQLREAMSPLAHEVALALDVDTSRAEELITTAALEGRADVIDGVDSAGQVPA